MLEPAEHAAVSFSGYVGHSGGDRHGQGARPSGENREDLEPGEWDGGGKVLEPEES